MREAVLLRGYGVHLAPGAPIPGPRRPPAPEAVLGALAPNPGPVRGVIYLPASGAIGPWAAWIAAHPATRHVHRIGRRLIWAHGDRPELAPGWLIGFDIAGEPAPAWLASLAAHRPRQRRIPGRDK